MRTWISLEAIISLPESEFPLLYTGGTLMLGKIEGGTKRGQPRMRWSDGITDLMDMFEETPGVGDGQGSLACCSPWGRKESDKTERLN